MCALLSGNLRVSPGLDRYHLPESWNFAAVARTERCFACPALQGVRDKYAALFVDGASTMQQFMWQQDVIGVAHFVQDCFDLLDAPV